MRSDVVGCERCRDWDPGWAASRWELLRPEREAGLRWVLCRENSKCSLGSPALEPLVAVDLWTTTFTTLGVFVGVEPLGVTKLEFGIRVGASNQPPPGRF